jgi:5-methylcytosine-specific restriction protein A
MDIPFVIGREYNRRQDIHALYGGSQQSGMSPCGTYPLIFLFTGPGGEQHGYQDRFAPDGRFFYTGEGQLGDMEFTRGNKALRDHAIDQRQVLLFEQSRTAHCRYLGECVYTGHHLEPRPDREGTTRQAIVFELAMEKLEEVEDLVALEAENPDLLPSLSKHTSLRDLRKLAETGSSDTVIPRSIQSRVYYRSIAVKRYALARARGVCESCRQAAPFRTKQGEPYLEVHHLFRVADGGPDKPTGVAAICPTCHRRIHNGVDGHEVNERLAVTIATLEMALD